MPRPTASPLFSTTSGSRTQPAPTTISQGYQTGSPLPAAHANWLWGVLGDWVEWFRTAAAVTINLASEQINEWRVVNVEEATVLSGPLVLKRGLKPTAGVVTGTARHTIPIPRIADGAAVSLSSVALNYIWQGPASLITIALVEQQFTTAGSTASIASTTIPTESATLAAFTWSPGTTLDPTRGYYISITMDRTNAGHVLEVYDVRAVISRPVGEG